MRNVFDQYAQPENKLTHALVCSLESQRHLILPFLKSLGIHRVPPVKDIRIVEQQLPGESESGEEGKFDSLPDASFFTDDKPDDKWAVIIESKVQAGANYDQLLRHANNARRRGFEKPVVVIISVDRQVDPPKGILAVEWREVYAWFNQQKHHSDWARRFVEYIEVFEAKMIAQDYQIRGTFTMFDGIHFDEKHPYNYNEAKRLVRLLGDDLQKRKDLHKLGIDPKGERRTAITGRDEDAVWDFLPLRAARGAWEFTYFPYLRFVVRPWSATAAVVVPNNVRGGFRKKLKAAGPDGFRGLILKIEERVEKRLGSLLRKKHATPWVSACQQHFASQRSAGEDDAVIEVDPRTLMERSKWKVKYQPQFIDAIYQVLCEKHSNIEFQAAVEFEYECPEIGTRKSLDLFAQAWRAMSPLLDFVLEDK